MNDNFIKWASLIGGVIVATLAAIHYIASFIKNFRDLGAGEFFKWTNISRLLKKAILPLATLFLVFGAYWYGKRNGDKQCKQRIALLLPLNEENKSSYQDGIRQFLGFTELLKDNPDYTNDFEFVIYDHTMNIAAAENAIRKEMRRGTKYFVVTMSKIAKPISAKFESLIKEEGVETNKPILISAVASSPKVSIQKNLSYRFYIRSQEEGKELALAVSKNKNIKSVVAIAVEDDYGKGAIEEFKNNWKDGVFEKPIYINSETKEIDGYREAISNQVNEIDNSCAIFIAHYGNGIDNIIKVLNELNIKRPIFATSTLSIKAWRDPIKDLLDKQEWYTCIPKYLSSDENHKDIIKDFMKYALQKTITAATELNKKKYLSFDEAWSAMKIPENLDVRSDPTNGDLIIEMTTIDKKNSYLK